MILLPRTTSAEAQPMAERLRRAVEVRLNHDLAPPRVSAAMAGRGGVRNRVELVA